MDLTVKDLAAHPRNPNRMDEETQKRLGKSLDAFGDLSGITYNVRSHTLVGGHHRLKEFPLDAKVEITQRYETPDDKGTVGIGFIKHLGSIYFVRLVDWDEPTHTAGMIAANKVHGEFDEPVLSDLLLDLDALNVDLDLTGFSSQEIEDIMAPLDKKTKQMEMEDDVPAVKEDDKRVKLGDLFILGNHRLLCGDSTNIDQVNRLMNGETADMVFTDPPYNHASEEKLVSQSVSQAMKKLSKSEWDKNFDISGVLLNIEKVIAENSTVYICTSWHLAGEIWSWMKKHSSCSGYCVWHKPNPMPSLMKRHWTWSSELICYSTYGKHVFNFPNEGHASNVWNINKNKANDLHPTMKPVEVPETAIVHSSKKEQSILDLFGGSGSTLIACEKTNRKCFMMELDPHYCAVILDRWAQYAGKDPVREDGRLWSDISKESSNNEN